MARSGSTHGGKASVASIAIERCKAAKNLIQASSSRTTTFAAPIPPKFWSANRNRRGDSVDDALDQLLYESQATLNYLDSLQAQIPSDELRRARKHAAQARGASNFWNPKCAGIFDPDDDDHNLEDCANYPDSESSASSGNEDMEIIWRSLNPLDDRKPSQKRGNEARSQPCRNFQDVRRGGIGTTAAMGARGKNTYPRVQRGFDAAFRSRDRSTPTASAPPPASHDYCHSKRADQGGFQFGNFGSDKRTADKTSTPTPTSHSAGNTKNSIEEEITCALVSAKGEGPASARKVLKRLLLQWHPDKASKGDNETVLAAQEQATRVLRHILEERTRLGL